MVRIVELNKKPIGKIIDTKSGIILKHSLYKPLTLLHSRVALLNLHDMSREHIAGRLEDQSDYKNRYQVRDIQPTDILPVNINKAL